MTNTDLPTGVVGELGAKAPCRVATTANITLEGLQTINGVSVVADDRVLVKNQTDLTENGIYIASTGEWQRAVDFDDILDGVPGTLVVAVEGDGSQEEGPNVLFVVALPNGETEITFGTTEIEFNFFAFASAGGGTYLLSGNNLSDVDSAATSRANLGLAIGTNVQAYNANLQAIAGLTSAANTIPSFTGSGTATLLTTGTSSGNVPLVGTASSTESLAGLAELATQAEVNAGIDASRIVTPATLQGKITAEQFESSEQTITIAGSLTLAHGLGVKPKKYQAFLKCLTAEGGYSIGDETDVKDYDTNDNGPGHGCQIVPDATNLNIRFGSFRLNILHKTTGADFVITPSNWSAIFRASINF